MVDLRRSVILGVTALCVACGGTPSPATSGAGTSRPSARLTASVPAPSGHAAPSSSAAWALPTVHLIDQRYTTPLLDVATDGAVIVWSTGAGGLAQHVAPDLYGYTPNGAEPAVLFHNPNRTSVLESLAVRDQHYAFVEGNDGLYGYNGWRIWYLPSAGAQPKLIDASDGTGGAASPVPFLAFTAQGIVWPAVHKRAGGVRFELRLYSPADGSVRELASDAATRTEYWFPSTDGGSRLVYATVEHSMSQQAFRVYLLDLGSPSAKPVLLDTDGDATMPVLSGDRVIWKQATNSNVFDSGLLDERAISEPSTSLLAFERQASLNYPSAGHRFVAAWGQDDTDFELFDLAANVPRVIERHEPTASVGVVRPVVRGDLLVFIRASGDPSASVPLQLCWMRLPATP